MKTYWFWWFTLTFPIGFAIPEAVALIRGRSQDTLSGAVWALEKFKPGQGLTGWTFFHLSFVSALLFVTLFLIGHFGWGWWR